MFLPKPVLLLLALSVALLALRLVRQQLKRMKKKKMGAMRHQYKRALEGQDAQLATDLGIAYYTMLGKGTITDVDRKRVEYAVMTMKSKKTEEPV